MIVALLASLLLAEAIAEPSNLKVWWGRRRRRRRNDQTPLPSPDPGKLCEWWKAGMTWDCSCKAHANSCVGCGRRERLDSYKDVTWWLSPCSKVGYKCAYARRRKKFSSLCGAEYLGQTGAHRYDPDGNKLWEGNYMGSKRMTPDKMLVARFTVDMNETEDKENGSKFKYFWGDDNEHSAGRNGYNKKGGCTAGYMGGGRCKCTCVLGRNMIATGDMRAMLPYRGPGDDELYKRPSKHGWNNNYGKHNEMYATYCVGVCGADCDGPKYTRTRFGKNIMFAVLVAHDVCQAYVGSKDPADQPAGIRNGCGDEVYARNWKDAASPASQGAAAAKSSLSGAHGGAGLSCDAGA